MCKLNNTLEYSINYYIHIIKKYIKIKFIQFHI